MPNDSRTPDEKQAPCECLGCAMQMLIVDQMVRLEAEGRGEEAMDDIMRAIASTIGNIIANSSPRVTREGLEQLRKMSLKAKAVYESRQPGASVH